MKEKYYTRKEFLELVNPAPAVEELLAMQIERIKKAVKRRK